MKTGLFICAAFLAAAGLFGAEWKVKDGAGSLTLKDSSPDKIDLKIETPETVTWAWEDDRGSFLNFADGTVTGPAEKLRFPDGMTLEIAFSAHLRRGSEWLPLVTCGDSFQSGYAVWARRNGQLLISLPGTSKGYMLLSPKLQDLRDYTLKVVRDGKRVLVQLDGKTVGDYVAAGKVKTAPGEPFRLGSTPKWKFFGNIYSVKIRPFQKGDFEAKTSSREESPASEIKAVTGIADPEGTVLFADFDRCTPRPYSGRIFSNSLWMFRKGLLFPPPAKGTLHCSDNPDAAVLTCDPKLKGVFDIYLGLRVTYFPTDLMISVPGVRDRLRVQIPGVERGSSGGHVNTEILLARDVKMDGGVIRLHPGGSMYLGYIKFIPSSKRRKVDYPRWKCVTVSASKDGYKQLAEKSIRSRIAKGYFIERKYVDDKKPPVPSAASEKLGCIVNAHDWMDLLFENAVPAKDPQKVSLAVKAAPGEYEPACLSVYGLRDLAEVSLSGGKELKKAGITSEIAVVRSLPKRSTNIYGPSEFMYSPQYLERVSATKVGKGVSKQFWITFRVADTAKPGTYRGSFELATPGGKMTVPVSVTVRPFKLDRPVREKVGLWGSGHEYHPKKAAELRAHGCNTVCMGFDKDFHLQEGKLDRIAGTPGANLIEALKDRLLAVIIETPSLTNQTFGRPGGDEKFRAAVKALCEYGRAHGWPKLYFYIYDEALSNPRTLKMAIWEARQLKACGVPVFSTHIWYKTSRPYQKEVDQIAPLVDAFCNRYSTRSLWYVDKWDEMQKRAVKEGKELWSYNIDRALMFAQPSSKRFAYGWFFRTEGKDCAGQLIFTYSFSHESPYTELDGGDGESIDWCYNYPAGKGHAGGFAINFEGIREGIDDLCYITTLENRIAEAKKKGLGKEAAAAEKVLADLKASFDFGPHYVKNTVFLDPAFDKNWEKNGKRFGSGRHNLPNGWRFEDYHAAREKIAGEIVKLDKVLKK